MSKLELKHLAPYLPYGLRGFIETRSARYEVEIVGWNYTTLHTNPSIHGYTNCSFEDFKPILHPLSDLVKPCLPDERTPAEEMEDDLMMSWCVAYDEAYEIITENEATLKAKAKMLPYEMVEWLFEHHFDVYGLIEQDLAVDINTLQI